MFGNPGRRQVLDEFPEAADTIYDTTSRSVSQGRYHLISYSNGAEELFDVRDDPLEQQNLARTHERVLERLRPLLPSF